jgi:hypothetical protein
VIGRRAVTAARAGILVALALAGMALVGVGAARAAKTATVGGSGATLPGAAHRTAAAARPTAVRPPAAPPVAPDALRQPARFDVAPAFHRLTAERALAIAERLPKIARERRRRPGSYGVAFEKGAARWQVSIYSSSGRHELAQVLIDDATGAVLEQWTGPQVAWTMARGYPGAFGRRVDALYIWLPLSLLFVVPFVDRRRPWRMLHLDLAALSAFSISLAFFNHGDVDASVPLAYQPLLYLLGRLAWVARRPGSEPLRLHVPARWLAVAVIFLAGFRVGLNLVNSNVIDVGYASVIGGDRLLGGQPLYGHFPHDNQHGDTYGPAAYEAYVPFVAAFGFSGHWDDLPSAHGATVAFDLLCLLLVFLLGRRIRGPTLGLALAYAWVTYPFTLFALESNTNDPLVAALLLGAVLVSAPAARGGLAALGALAKFAPLALAPVLAVGAVADRGRRAWLSYALGFAALGALACLPLLGVTSVSTFWRHSVQYQAERGSPFSVWGLYGGLDTAQTAVQAGAVAFVLVAAWWARRADRAALAALCAAVLIALQLGATHWFYLYIPWFFGLAMTGLLGRAHEDRLDPCGPHRLLRPDQHAHQPGVLA